MEKVKLTKKDVDKIESLKEELGTYWKQNLLNRYLNNGVTFYAGFDDILSALANGYEVEHTPEDKVREYAEELKFKHMSNNGGRNDTETSYGHELRGCMRTLDKLGINIEGVNA